MIDLSEVGIRLSITSQFPNNNYLIELDPIHNNSVAGKQKLSLASASQNKIDIIIEGYAIPETDNNNNEEPWNQGQGKRTAFLIGDRMLEDNDGYVLIGIHQAEVCL